MTLLNVGSTYDLSNKRLDAVEQLNLLSDFAAILTELFLYMAFRQTRGLPDISVKQGIDYVLSQNPPLTSDKRLALLFMIRFYIETGLNASYARLSLYELASDLVGITGQENLVPGGFDQIPKVLATGLDIRFEHVVQEVDYGSGFVRVQTDHGTFTARRAVITLPHAMLRRGEVHFSPPLPAEKLNAINRIRTGLTDKYWFLFPRAFWYSRPDFLGHIPRQPGQWISWYNEAKYTGHPELVAFNSIGYARLLEDASDDRVVDEAMRVLRGLYGTRIPDPVGMVRSRWGQERFSRGALSYLPVGATTADRLVLGKSVNTLLFFAGEATSPLFPASTNGAYETGRAAAREIAAQIGIGART